MKWTGTSAEKDNHGNCPRGTQNSQRGRIKSCLERCRRHRSRYVSPSLPPSFLPFPISSPHWKTSTDHTVVADVAKSTVAGSSKTASGMIDSVKGKAKQNSTDSGTQLGGLGDQLKGGAKKMQGDAESKAEAVKQKL